MDELPDIPPQPMQLTPTNRTAWERPATPYERHMESEGVPIYRGVDGIRDVRELGLDRWQRLDCDGAFVQLRGLGGLQGMHVVRIPPLGHVAAQRHVYEAVFYVVEGEGATRVWSDDNPTGATARWSDNALFTVPLNGWYELVNESNEPALLIVATNAPPVMQIFRSHDFIFANPWVFADRLDNSLSNYGHGQDELGVEPLTQRAMYTASVLPDAAALDLPLDGQRGEDYRHVELEMGGNVYTGFVGEYPGQSYGKTHSHRSGPMIICLKGYGYTLTWPEEYGTHPWEVGRGDDVKRLDYRQGGVMSPVPGDDAWFHGHYNATDQPLRVMAHLGAYPKLVAGDPGEVYVDVNADIEDGGKTIRYANEDPYVRDIFEYSRLHAG